MEPKSLSCRQYVALEHGTFLHSCQVGDISSRFPLASVGLGNLFDLSSALCLVAMTSDPLMSNIAKLTVMPPCVQEKLTSTSINLPLILI